MRIGIMTGGGDCPGLNAAIRAVTRVALTDLNAEVIGIRDGFEGLLQSRTVDLDLEKVRGILRVGGTILGSSARTNPWMYSLTPSALPTDCSKTAHLSYLDLGLDGLVVIGGDGTLFLANRFSQEYDVPVVGIPKTIDNDVRGCDYSIGFDSAVTTVTDAVDKLHTTAESHHRVMLVEAMGRNAGWIALFAGVAGGADIILLPEKPHSLDGLIQKIEDRRTLGRHFTVAVVAEGVANPAGEFVYRSASGVRHQWKLGGICDQLTAELASRTSHEVRSIVLGHLQRGGSPTAFDRNLATILGARAVTMLANGLGSNAVGLQGGKIVRTPLADVAAGPRTVPLDHPLLDAACRMGIYCGD